MLLHERTVPVVFLNLWNCADMTLFCQHGSDFQQSDMLTVEMPEVDRTDLKLHVKLQTELLSAHVCQCHFSIPLPVCLEIHRLIFN